MSSAVTTIRLICVEVFIVYVHSEDFRRFVLPLSATTALPDSSRLPSASYNATDTFATHTLSIAFTKICCPATAISSISGTP
ncbi:hypothetical protein MKQ68_14945 [Chitinophaga horti]|uniref:Secreted protein n=1 Tax=Chitinophaga horti TaxID=2920382 RepID=A0ABY6IZG8_9BACT|nr:hypothetical protein [Chitinophaga horti]UYQ91389.1 hypothetical protein MKQ68_14945 [Chitinophaga horti]